MFENVGNCFRANKVFSSLSITPYVLFVVLGTSWIFLSDWALLLLQVPESYLELTSLQTLKGLFFVVATACCFLVLGRQMERRLQRAEQSVLTLAQISRDTNDLIWRCDANIERFEVLHSDSLETQKVMRALNNHLVHPEDIPAEMKAWERALIDKKKFRTFSRVNMNGEYRYYRNDIFPVVDASGQIIEWLGACRDIHEIYEYQEALSHKEELLRLAANAGGVGIWEWDQRGNKLCASEEMERQVGASLSKPADLRTYIHPDDYPAVRKVMLAAKRRSTPFDVEYRVVSEEGDIKWILNKGTTYCRMGSNSRHMLGVSIDITDVKHAQEKYRFIAEHDVLTGLPNRRTMKAWLRDFTGKKAGGDFSLGVVDIDFFSRVNEVYGHRVGDALLVATADKLREFIDPSDFVCRYGSDRFLLVLQGTESQTSLERFKRVLGALAKPCDIDGKTLNVSFSSGVVSAMPKLQTWQDYTRSAELALGHSKAARRGQMTVYDESMAVASARFESIRNELYGVVAKQELSVVFQPQLSLKDGRVGGLEALVRWHSPLLGPVSPVEFIPIAEKIGVINAVGSVVLEQIATHLYDWRAKGCIVETVAFNLSPASLEHAGDAETFNAEVEKFGLSSEDIVLEITETAVVQNTAVMAENLEKLVGMGYQLAMDDFGTGYSSLETLYKSNITKLKIDKSFIRPISGSAKHANIVRSLIALAHSVDIEVIAEGVEDEEQLQMLQAWGCDTIQGYIFARPMPASDAAAFLLGKRIEPLPAATEGDQGQRRTPAVVPVIASLADVEVFKRHIHNAANGSAHGLGVPDSAGE
jgi:diguanylate cyclase (GGDEF)-like protein/PAS domain S-box-containing protein